MGQQQHTSSHRSSPAPGRFPARTCHRRHCGRVFRPRQWNQRYCREPDCLRELHRWQAAKRQRHRRSHEAVRQQHADAERQRRSRKREQRRVRETAETPLASPPARIDAPDSRAWSRSKNAPQILCDRPGCYDPVRPSCRARARYCVGECRRDVRRVSDRERKYKNRRKKETSPRGCGEFHANGEDRRQAASATVKGRGLHKASSCPNCVRGYGSSPQATVSSCETCQEVSPHDRETLADRRPRAPPSA
jgi:hypothetical protein